MKLPSLKCVAGTLVLLLFAAAPVTVSAQEQASVRRIEQDAQADWVWVTDISFPNFVPGRAHLVDAASGQHLGMLTMGYGLSPLGLPRHGREFYTIETHYDRTVRGNRTDIVGIRDVHTLKVVHEIEIPPKKLSAVPMLSTIALTDDDRFLLIYNFTPAQSVSVVDLEQRRFSGEIAAAGCGLTLAAGARRFLMLCGDGAMMQVTLDDDGIEAGRTVIEGLFNADAEFVTEKAVRIGDTWYFVTNRGEIRPYAVGGEVPQAQTTWPLFSQEEHAAGWYIGGQQHLAAHQGSGELYAAVHQGEQDSHKDPGTHVFVYAADSGQRVRQIQLENPAAAIQVTQGDAPLLLATNAYPPLLEVYDARSGKLLRSLADVAATPMLLQTPVGGENGQ